MPKIYDDEFGEITVTRRSLATRVSLTVAPNGRIRISLPTKEPLLSAKMLLKSSRDEIRQLLANHHDSHAYLESQQIGKSHSLLIQAGIESVLTRGTNIIASAPNTDILASLPFQQKIRTKIIAALKKEAKHYLPRRLKYLAEQYGFDYEKVRLTHSSSRWGSCSSKGTISLNIALMNLPFELLDYVLIHELCHTRQMNHSQDFWREVSAIDPNYATHRRQLKQHTPHV